MYELTLTCQNHISISFYETYSMSSAVIIIIFCNCYLKVKAEVDVLYRKTRYLILQ
jgi:hypothetical protein